MVFLRTCTVIMAHRLWAQIWRFILQSEVLLPVAQRSTTLQATVNVKEQIRLYGKPSNYYYHWGWPEERWQDVLQEALHAMQSLLCTVTNETPHEWTFRFQRRATSGIAMPTWLLTEGPVLLRRHVQNKSDPLCDEVLLLEANPWYVHIQHSNGQEDTVSTSDLAPCPNEGIELENSQVIPAVEAEVPTNIPVEAPPADADQHKPMNDVEPDLSSTSNEMSPVVHSWLLPIVQRVYLLLIMPESVCNCIYVSFTWGDCGNCVMPTG